ncbi:MAG: hypothetical protein OXU42_13085 [Deltaproteobacteria bacterium]|nr:hypothetical protein [Deltaproteobacteria bacterium]
MKAAVRSTLPEALAEALTMEWTVQEGEVRRPVTAKPAPGEANAEGDADDERSEANGVSAGDVAEGGEPSESARRARQAVRSRSGAADRLDVQWAPR